MGRSTPKSKRLMLLDMPSPWEGYALTTWEMNPLMASLLNHSLNLDCGKSVILQTTARWENQLIEITISLKPLATGGSIASDK